MSEVQGQEAEFSPTGRTMLAIVPPPDICGFADHYRRLYMPDERHRIETHITITIPFVPFEELEEATSRLLRVLENCPPRALAIRGFATFQEEGVLYLYLAHPERVLSIYRAILAEFPQYPAYEGRYGDSSIPHITVGKFADPEELMRVYAEVSVQRLFMGWDVEWLSVKYEGDDDRWHTWASIQLGE